MYLNHKNIVFEPYLSQRSGCWKNCWINSTALTQTHSLLTSLLSSLREYHLCARLTQLHQIERCAHRIGGRRRSLSAQRPAVILLEEVQSTIGGRPHISSGLIPKAGHYPFRWEAFGLCSGHIVVGWMISSLGRSRQHSNGDESSHQAEDYVCVSRRHFVFFFGRDKYIDI